MEEIDSFANIFHEIVDLLKNAERTTVFFDSIDIISLHSSFDRVIVLLKGISQYATVIARMHDECISAENWERLSSIAHVTYSLELRDMTALCTVISYKADGKRNLKVFVIYADFTSFSEDFPVVHKDLSVFMGKKFSDSVGTIYIDDSFRSFFKQYQAQDASTSAERNINLFMPESSFDIGLHLRKSEREARERVPLPYETAQKEEELVRLRIRENRKIRAGGRIIYSPDEADDFDESDPDDDLEI